MESASIAAGHARRTTSTTARPPANVSSRVEAQFLGMLLFIISEVMLFGAFFTAYFFIRVVADDEWFPLDGIEPPEGDRRREHGDPGLVELHDALGARGRAQREPQRAAGRPRSPPSLLGLDLPHGPDQRVRAHRLRAARQRAGHDLLRAHRPARRPRVRRPDAAHVRDDPRLPRPLHGQGAPRRRGARASTGTSSTSCGSSCTRRSTSSRSMLNPLRSEQEAFRFLLYVVAVAAVVRRARARSSARSLSADLELAERAARAAGEVLLAYYGRPPEGLDVEVLRHRPGLGRRPRGGAG